MTEQAKVPAIRFAGFTDPWEQRKLSEVATLAAGILRQWQIPITMKMDTCCGLRPRT